MSTYFWTSTSSTDPTIGANWTKSDGTTGTAPASGDDAVIQAIPGSALANIGASNMSTVALNSLTISASFTGTIGAVGIGGYWQISAGTLTIGSGSGSGSGRIKLNLGTNACVGTVLLTGTSLDSGYEAVRVLGTNAGNKLAVLSGTVGIATNQPGETATFAEIDTAGSQAIVNVGSGVTWTNAYAASGTLTLNSGSTGTLTVNSGATVVVNGSGAIATVNAGGTTYLNNRPASGAGITTLNLLPTGTADFSYAPANVTVTTLNFNKGGTLKAFAANPGHLTITTRNLIGTGTVVAQ